MWWLDSSEGGMLMFRQTIDRPSNSVNQRTWTNSSKTRQPWSYVQNKKKRRQKKTLHFTVTMAMVMDVLSKQREHACHPLIL